MSADSCVVLHSLMEPGSLATLEKQQLHVAVAEVLGDAAGNDGAVVVEGFDVGFTHHRGDLEADVKELADVGVVKRVALVVA